MLHTPKTKRVAVTTPTHANIQQRQPRRNQQPDRQQPALLEDGPIAARCGARRPLQHASVKARGARLCWATAQERQGGPPVPTVPVSRPSRRERASHRNCNLSNSSSQATASQLTSFAAQVTMLTHASMIPARAHGTGRPPAVVLRLLPREMETSTRPPVQPHRKMHRTTGWLHRTTGMHRTTGWLHRQELSGSAGRGL